MWMLYQLAISGRMLQEKQQYTLNAVNRSLVKKAMFNFITYGIWHGEGQFLESIFQKSVCFDLDSAIQRELKGEQENKV